MIVDKPVLPVLGLGCSRIGSFSNRLSRADAIRLIQSALDLGVSLIDTANIYGQGDSERTVGHALKHRRREAFVVTKAGQCFSPVMRAVLPLKPLIRRLAQGRSGRPSRVTEQRAKAIRADWNPQAITRSLDASLRRLGTDHVDGFLLHSPPADALTRFGLADLLEAVKASGKARFVGVSCDDLASLDLALNFATLDILELPFNMLEAAVDRRIHGRDVAVIAREVINLQPTLDPIAAIRIASAVPVVDTTLIGTTRIEHLTEIATQALSR